MDVAVGITGVVLLTISTPPQLYKANPGVAVKVEMAGGQMLVGEAVRVTVGGFT